MQNRPCRGGHHGAAIFCGIHCSQVRAVVVCYELLLAPKKTNSPGWARAIHPGQGPTERASTLLIVSCKSPLASLLGSWPTPELIHGQREISHS
jgi:hypothetical protein